MPPGPKSMKREFVINRHGKDYVLYAGLLDLAHQQGLQAIKTHLIQAPTAENGQVAICLAEVTTEKGTFTGIGDADPGNVNRMMANALIRMAETRAKARAMRDAVNVGLVALEELAEGAMDGPGAEDAPPRSAAQPAEILTFPEGGARTGARSATAELQTRRLAADNNDEGASPVAVPSPVEAPASRAPSTSLPAARPTSARPAATRQAETQPLPATQTQLETIDKLARSTGRTVPTEGLTRAAASELITRLSEERYGSRRSP
ncbi:MAG TPA: hypothetical protein VHS99_13345 [Chloroflexota bacterium]|nr:hypothetical protein [Chloroflexota bacterium]